MHLLIVQLERLNAVVKERDYSVELQYTAELLGFDLIDKQEKEKLATMLIQDVQGLEKHIDTSDPSQDAFFDKQNSNRKVRYPQIHLICLKCY